MRHFRRIKKTIRMLSFAVWTTILLEAPAFAAPNSRDRITDVDFSTLTDLLVRFANWVFGIGGLFIGIAAVKKGIEIAFSDSNPSDRASAKEKLGGLILGGCICFGAWLITGVLKGLFIQ